MKKKVVLLVNLGTPDKPTMGAVAKYLFQFLNDKFVIDLPWLLRIMLVNLIIIPFRTPLSTKLYRQLWTEKGSPLLHHLQNLTKKLQQHVPNSFIITGAMRYGNPSVKQVLKNINKQDVEEIIIIPLYPQYATSTTESAKQHIQKILKKEKWDCNIHFIEQFYNQNEFIHTFANQIQKYQPETYDHVLFSYHGLPMNQVQNLHPNEQTTTCACEHKMPPHGEFCYKATCYETSRLLAGKLNIPRNKYDVVFQSRFSDNWLKPFFDIRLLVLLKLGKKKILVISPSFVADCLETKVEIEKKYADLFIKKGGEKLTLVESLNDNDLWVEELSKMILRFSAETQN